MRIAVIGNGMVGQRFLEKLAAKGEHEITVFCEEPRPAYDRVQLTSFFSGKSAADLSVAKTMTLTTDVNGDGVISIGDRVAFTITLKNLGPNAAGGVHIDPRLGFQPSPISRAKASERKKRSCYPC